MEIAPELLLSSFCYPWRLNLKNYKGTKIGFDFHYEHTFVYLFQSLYLFLHTIFCIKRHGLYIKSNTLYLQTTTSHDGNTIIILQKKKFSTENVICLVPWSKFLGTCDHYVEFKAPNRQILFL